MSVELRAHCNGRILTLEKATVSITKNSARKVEISWTMARQREGAPQYATKISTTKTRSTRIVPLNRNALKRLHANVAGRTIHGARRLCALHGQRRQPATPRQMEKAACISAASNSPWILPPCGRHMLRHTCANLLFSKKLQVEIIATDRATARKCAVEPTYISVRNSVRRPYSRLQSLTTFRCVHRENIL